MKTGSVNGYTVRHRGRTAWLAQIGALCAFVLLLSATAGAFDFDSDEDFDPEKYEESAGSSFAFFAGQEGKLIGMSFGSGTWLKNTPVFGDFFISLFQNDMVDSLCSGVGMTFRLMPHGKYAPFVGAGGSYNYAWSSLTADTGVEVEPGQVSVDGSESGANGSYWGGHVEAGMRVWLDARLRLIEICGRYTWCSLGEDSNYWLVMISTGPSW